MNTSTLIQKVWNFCNTLRDDGVSYGDYLEQLTYLLFLKMAHEYAQPPHNREIRIPSSHNWSSLLAKPNTRIESHYASVLNKLSRESGMLGAIFFKAQNKIQDPAKLSRLIQMIDEQNWINMSADTKGDLYEGLLQKNAEDTKSGAGQYFTSRPIIEAIIECVQPEPGKTIADPACGTGGFFLGAYNWLTRPGTRLTEKQKNFLQSSTFYGNEIVANTRRLCLMNLFLHNIGDMEKDPSIERSDALTHEPKVKVDYVFANPPFGKKSSMTFTTEEGDEDRDALTYERHDFWETTSNKQLNFLQHIASLLKPNGKASVIVPDNVLFEGGAGEKIRRKLLQNCDVHTILRLPPGIFYAQGVKANVVFFDNAPRDGKVHTKGVWFYDMRTNRRFTLRTRTLKHEDLQDFISCYNAENRLNRSQSDRFRFYSYDELISRDKASMDVFWLSDESLDSLESLPAPDVLQQEIIEHLEAALTAFRDVAAGLPKTRAT